MINKLPKRFQWTIHNLIAHPLMEILFQLGFKKLSELVHDSTVPKLESDQNDNKDNSLS